MQCLMEKFDSFLLEMRSEAAGMDQGEKKRRNKAEDRTLRGVQVAG